MAIKFNTHSQFASAATIGALILLTGTSLQARQADGFTPHFEAELSLEVQSDHTFKSDDPDNEVTDTYPTLGLGVGWMFTPDFSVQGGFVLEPVVDPHPGEDRFFEHIGVYTEELYAQYEAGAARLFAGKFNPSFGHAFDLTPGLYSTAFAEDYQLTERLGFGGAYSIKDTAVGNLTWTASAFKRDTTILSRSIGTDRGKVSSQDGGVGNTRHLGSYTVTVDGSDIAISGGNLAWHLGYAYQSKGQTINDIASETALVGGLYGNHSLHQRLSLDWLAEVAHLENAGGNTDDVSYWTLGGAITLDKRYNLAIAHTSRHTHFATGNTLLDTSSQISVGMEIHAGWSLDVGYKFAKEQGVKSQTVGLLIGKTFTFGSAN